MAPSSTEGSDKHEEPVGSPARGTESADVHNTKSAAEGTKVDDSVSDIANDDSKGDSKGDSKSDSKGDSKSDSNTGDSKGDSKSDLKSGTKDGKKRRKGEKDSGSSSEGTFSSMWTSVISVATLVATAVENPGTTALIATKGTEEERAAVWAEWTRGGTPDEEGVVHDEEVWLIPRWAIVKPTDTGGFDLDVSVAGCCVDLRSFRGASTTQKALVAIAERFADLPNASKPDSDSNGKPDGESSGEGGQLPGPSTSAPGESTPERRARYERNAERILHEANHPESPTHAPRPPSLTKPTDTDTALLSPEKLEMARKLLAARMKPFWAGELPKRKVLVEIYPMRVKDINADQTSREELWENKPIAHTYITTDSNGLLGTNVIVHWDDIKAAAPEMAASRDVAKEYAVVVRARLTEKAQKEKQKQKSKRKQDAKSDKSASGKKQRLPSLTRSKAKDDTSLKSSKPKDDTSSKSSKPKDDIFSTRSKPKDDNSSTRSKPKGVTSSKTSKPKDDTSSDSSSDDPPSIMETISAAPGKMFGKDTRTDKKPPKDAKQGAPEDEQSAATTSDAPAEEPALTAAEHSLAYRLAKPNGIRIISDMDDTVKLSDILGGAREVFRNVFCRPNEDLCIPGMDTLFADLASAGVGGLHFVSLSPVELLPALGDFLRAHKFPPASLTLKFYGPRALLAAVYQGAGERKRAGLQEVLNAFPESRFLLFGDSGEQDLEIYTVMAQEHPKQIAAIFIRDVSGGRHLHLPAVRCAQIKQDTTTMPGEYPASEASATSVDDKVQGAKEPAVEAIPETESQVDEDEVEAEVSDTAVAPATASPAQLPLPQRSATTDSVASGKESPEDERQTVADLQQLTEEQERLHNLAARWDQRVSTARAVLPSSVLLRVFVDPSEVADVAKRLTRGEAVSDPLASGTIDGNTDDIEH